jgi:hypothetical protein
VVGLHVGDDAHVRPEERKWSVERAGAGVRADLDDPELISGARREDVPRDVMRIVPRSLRGPAPELRREHRADQVLCRGLASAARHADDDHAAQPRPVKRGESRHRVLVRRAQQSPVHPRAEPSDARPLLEDRQGGEDALKGPGESEGASVENVRHDSYILG